MRLRYGQVLSKCRVLGCSAYSDLSVNGAPLTVKVIDPLSANPIKWSKINQNYQQINNKIPVFKMERKQPGIKFGLNKAH